MVLVTNTADDAGEVRNFFRSRAATLTDAHAGGGETALSSALLATLAADAVPGSTVTASSITPASGPVAGGTSFTITGTGLAGVTGVTFCGVAATAVVAGADGTSVTGVTPAGAAGACAVVVSSPEGAASVPGGFTYVAVATTISAIAPASGSTVGGTSVTITGTNLGGATSVTFCGTPVAIASATATSIGVSTPPKPAGPCIVNVSTPNGPATTTFTYIATGGLSLASRIPSSPVATGDDFSGTTPEHRATQRARW